MEAAMVSDDGGDFFCNKKTRLFSPILGNENNFARVEECERVCGVSGRTMKTTTKTTPIATETAAAANPPTTVAAVQTDAAAATTAIAAASVAPSSATVSPTPPEGEDVDSSAETSATEQQASYEIFLFANNERFNAHNRRRLQLDDARANDRRKAARRARSLHRRRSRRDDRSGGEYDARADVNAVAVVVAVARGNDANRR